MEIDLSTKSLSELKALRKDVEKAISSFEKRQRKQALAAAEAAAAEAGFSLTELVGVTGRAKKPARPAKYRNPEDSSQTWSGRGRQPEWFKSKLKSGLSAEALLITPE